MKNQNEKETQDIVVFSENCRIVFHKKKNETWHIGLHEATNEDLKKAQQLTQQAKIETVEHEGKTVFKLLEFPLSKIGGITFYS